MRLVAIREMWYAGRTRHPGDEFEAPESDARFFLADDLGGGAKARKIEEALGPKPIAPTTNVQTITPESTPQTSPESTEVKPMDTDSGLLPGGPTRRYRRRNMTAED